MFLTELKSQESFFKNLVQHIFLSNAVFLGYGSCKVILHFTKYENSVKIFKKKQIFIVLSIANKKL